MVQPWKPKSFALAVWIQKPSGGLSTVTKPPGSKETKKKLCQIAACVDGGGVVRVPEPLPGELPAVHECGEREHNAETELLPREA